MKIVITATSKNCDNCNISCETSVCLVPNFHFRFTFIAIVDISYFIFDIMIN